MLQFFFMRPPSELPSTNHHEGNGRVWHASELTPAFLEEVFGPGWKQLIAGEFVNHHFVLHDSDWHDPPATHGNDSRAFYAIDELEAAVHGSKHLGYASILAPGDISSIHRHVYPELYVPKRGGVFVLEEGEEIWVPAGTSHVVAPGIYHQAKAPSNHWSLTFIKGIDGGRIPKDSRHVAAYRSTR